MSYFPITIRFQDNKAIIVNKPEEIPQGVSFTVIKTSQTPLDEAKSWTNQDFIHRNYEVWTKIKLLGSEELVELVDYYANNTIKNDIMRILYDREKDWAIKNFQNWLNSLRKENQKILLVILKYNPQYIIKELSK